MISHIEGSLELKSGGIVVIDVGGIGYEVHVPSHVCDQLPAEGQRCRLYIYTLFREEDGMSLYGFTTSEEREFFKLLLTVSGVGPKMALSIMSSITASDLSDAIVMEDIKRLTRISGIGKKTAQRLVLELKDKVADMCIIKHEKKPDVEDYASRDAADALVSLGYSKQVAITAVAKARETFQTTPKLEELIKTSLRYL